MLFVQDGPAGYRGGVMPRQSAIGPGFRLFDPIGRTKRLFNRPRTENGLAERGTEATMPGPLRLRPLAKDLNDLRAGRAGAGRYFLTRPVVQVRLDGAQVALADLHCCNLEDRDDGLGGIVWNRPATPGHVMFDPVLGRLSLNPADEAKAVEVAFAYGTPHDIGSGPYDRRDQVATWLADFKGGAGDPPPWQVGVTRRSQEVTNNPNQGGPVVATLAAAIQAWNQQAVAGTRGIITILDSATYAENLETPSRLINLPAGARLAIVAAGWPVTPGSGGTKTRKPAQLTPQDRCPHIASNLLVKGTAAGVGDAGVLILDGLLIEGVVRVQAGDLGRLEIRHCTLGAGAMAMGPGLIVAGGAAGDNTRLNLCIDHSITGSVDAGLAAGRVCICDSILGEARVADGDPLNAPVVLAAAAADLVIGRSTLFGKTTGRTLEADDSIFVGPLHIARRQGGCLRFCYLPETSRVPRRYRCTPDLQIAQTKETLGRAFTSADELTIRERIRPMFTSTLAEHHAFGQLSPSLPSGNRRGGGRRRRDGGDERSQRSDAPGQCPGRARRIPAVRPDRRRDFHNIGEQADDGRLHARHLPAGPALQRRSSAAGPRPDGRRSQRAARYRPSYRTHHRRRRHRPTGMPEAAPGFLITAAPASPGTDLLIGDGRAYVNGVLVEHWAGTATLTRVLDAGINTVWELSDGPRRKLGHWVALTSDLTNLAAVSALEPDGANGKQRFKLNKAYPAGNTKTVQFFASAAVQPNLPSPAWSQANGTYLAYLDVWEREITALEDPAIADVALGGPDTALRSQVIWQVRFLDLAPLQAAGQVGTPPMCKSFGPGWSPLGPRTALKAWADATAADDNPCELPAQGGYRSLENHLYRVEIHRGGAPAGGQVRIKWSRDNAIHRSRLLDVVDGALVVEELGKDDATAFATDNWVEVRDEGRILRGEPGFFVEIGEIVGTRLGIRTILDPVTLLPLVFNSQPNAAVLPTTGLVRRWEGGAPVAVTAGAALDLERGVRFPSPVARPWSATTG
jgi:hypothetical protein